jgi:spore germination cell wall hydrolase CwlJ-like protein
MTAQPTASAGAEPVRLDGPTLFALTVWMEARGESQDGRAAVALVYLNRTRRKYHSDGTLEGTALAPAQFSDFWFSMVDGHYTRVARTRDEAMARAVKKLAEARKNLALWNACQAVSLLVRDGNYDGGPEYEKLTPDTVLYFNPAICKAPAWADPKKRVATIGHHVFYRA